MGTLKINNQEVFTETAGVVSAGSGHPAGHVLQVVIGVERETVDSTTQNWSDISDDLKVDNKDENILDNDKAEEASIYGSTQKIPDRRFVVHHYASRRLVTQ